MTELKYNSKNKFTKWRLAVLCKLPTYEKNEHELIPALPTSQPSQQMYLSRQDENYLVANGVKPLAILPSGTFKNCSFSFNINKNKI